MSNHLIPEIKTRRSRRALSDKPVPPAVVERILAAATLAPSCMNNQPWRFVVVAEEPALGEVKKHLTPGNYWAKKSPFIVLLVTKEDLDCKPESAHRYAFFATGMAAQNLQLQAVREGLVAHPIAGFNVEGVGKTAGIPEEYSLIALIILGYPGDPSELSDKHRESETSERIRKDAAAVIFANRWAAFE